MIALVLLRNSNKSRLHKVLSPRRELIMIVKKGESSSNYTYVYIISTEFSKLSAKRYIDYKMNTIYERNKTNKNGYRVVQKPYIPSNLPVNES